MPIVNVIILFEQAVGDVRVWLVSGLEVLPVLWVREVEASAGIPFGTLVTIGRYAPAVFYEFG